MKSAFVRSLIGSVGLVALVALPAHAQDSGIGLGEKAPAAAVVTLDGKAADISSHLGKGPVLIEFWATWCPVCKELEPKMTALHAKYGKQVDFVNVAVSVNESPALVNRYVRAHKTPGTHYFDAKGEATGAYDVPATSYIVVIDKAGKVVYTGVGADQATKIEAVIKKLIP
jgi:thiol-disulfide isomerase/thioredoxin